MEKKDWRERLGSYDSWAMNESMFITIDGETIYTLGELIDFISEEVSKAREEGRREGVYNTLLEINRIKSLKVDDYIIEPKTEMPIKITKIQDGELFYYGYDDEDNDYTAGYSATPEDLVDWGYKAKLSK